jgi:hypothetical protein
MSEHTRRSGSEEHVMTPSRSLPTLPYNSLSWQGFESFVAELIGQLPGFESVQHYGAFPDDQRGVDILARNAGANWAFQCKRVREFRLPDFQRAVNRAETFGADRFVLVLSCRAGARLIDAAQSAGWEIWDAGGLDLRVRSLSDAFSLLNGYFGRAVAKAFLGRQRPGIFLSPSDYFAPYLRPERAEDLGTPLIDRTEQLQALCTFYTDPTKRVMLIVGPSGVGKRKLLFELTRSISDSEHSVRFARESGDLDDESLDELPAGVTMLAIDNVRGTRRIEEVASAMLRSHEKLLLVVRAGDAAAVGVQLQGAGYDSDVTAILRVNQLSRSEVAELVKATLPSGVTPVSDGIYRWSSGIPLVVQVITYLIREGHHDLFKALSTAEYPVAILFARYADVLAGKIAEDQACPKADILSVLRLMAAVSPRDIRTVEFRDAATGFLGWESSRLSAAVKALEAGDVLLRSGSRTRIIPELVGLYILRDACATEPIESDFAQTLVRQFGYDRQVLLNFAAVDRLDNAASATLRAVWRYLSEQVKASTAFERLRILDELDDVGYLLPRFMLDIVEFVIKHPAQPDDEQPWQNLHRFDQADVVRKLPAILRSIARSDIEVLPRCVQILWELGRNEEPHFGYESAFEVLVNLASYRRYTSSSFILTILNEVERINARPDEQRYRHLPTEVAAPALTTSYDDFESHGASVTVQRMAIDPAAVAEVRAKAIEIMAAALNSADLRAASTAAKYLSDALLGSRLVSETARGVQTREQRHVLDLFHTLRADDSRGLLTARIASLLSWHAQVNANSYVRGRASGIVAGLEGTPEFDWYASLIPDIARHMPSVKVGSDYRQLQESIDALLHRVVDRILEQHRNPRTLVKAVIEVFDEAGAAGLNPGAGWLFIELSNRDLDYAQQVADVIIAEFGHELGDAISPVLCAAWSDDGKWADRAIARALDSNEQKLLGSVASALWMRRDAVGDVNHDADRRVRVLTALIERGDKDVKKAALRAVGTLLSINRPKALELILSLDIGDDAAIGDELFANLRAVEPSELGTSGLARMLDYLTTIKELDYWAMEFLRQIAKERSADVLDVLMRRIERSDDLSAKDGYKPVPYGHAMVPHEVQFFDELNFSSSGAGQALDRGFALKDRGRFWFAELMSNLARRPLLFEALETWIADSDSVRVQFLADAMHRIPASFIFEHEDFVADLVERATALGEETGRRVSSAFFSAATSGLRSGLPFEPMPEDVTMINRAKVIRSSLAPNSAAYKLFDEVAQYGEERVTKQLESDIDDLGEPE